MGRGNRLRPVTHLQLLARDTSQLGWGAVHAGLGVRGAWTGRQLNQHIKALVLRAIHLALLQFLPRLQGHHVLVRTDSTVAAAYVSRQGGLCLTGLAPPRAAGPRIMDMGTPTDPLTKSYLPAGPPKHSCRLAVQESGDFIQRRLRRPGTAVGRQQPTCSPPGR